MTNNKLKKTADDIPDNITVRCPTCDRQWITSPLLDVTRCLKCKKLIRVKQSTKALNHVK